MAATTPGTCYIKGEQVTDCPPISPHVWVPPPAIPGEYWAYHGYTGPRPKEWFESPMSYQLVKAGKLPPLAERVPPPEDRGILHGPSGIGYYGGENRQTGTQQFLGEWIRGGWAIRDSNGFDWEPWLGKSWEISDDGTQYTMVMRKNVHWSDGTPFTMDDIRFGWEDNNFNTELNKVITANYRDPVTDNPVTFGIVDDVTWTMTFDTPVYTLFEDRSLPRSWCAKGSFVMYCPPYLRQFHPKYADPVVLQQLLDEANLEDWTQLYSQKNNILTNPDRPCIAPWCTKSKKDLQITAERNHYYYFFDPEGNQLPYMDWHTKIQMETREVAIFRSMNGETDAMTTPFSLPEVPLYNANMEKGDYSIYHWPSTGGVDSGVGFSMSYNEDPEIGRLVRTRDFRLALSHAIDREAINETVYLGVGVIQTRVPHPSTPYYPGPVVAQMNIAYDIDLANKKLDDLGLTERDSEGFRLRQDGSGEAIELRMTLSHGSVWFTELSVAEMIKPMWEEVGIKGVINLVDNPAAEVRQGNEYLQMGQSAIYQANPWMVTWGSLAPLIAGHPIAAGVGLWQATSGAEGMAPGPNPDFLPLAPPENFAVDPSGNLMRTIEIFKEGRAFERYDPRRIALGKEIFEIHATEMWQIPIAAFIGSFRGILITRNNVMNKPITHIMDHNGFNAWVYYFLDGKDNMNHPENRSGLPSTSFLGGG